MLLRRIALSLTATAALYGIALVAVSITSDPIVLGFGQPKRLCGFYLDCHRMVEVTGVETTDRLVSESDTLRAAGRFHVVSLRYRSDAVRATLRMGPLAATVHDADGRSWERDSAAERFLADATGLVDLRLSARGSVTTRIVFDLPVDAYDPRLYVRDAHPVSRLTEFFLIGDEDSFLHRRTLFGLSAETPQRAALRAATVDLLAVRVDTAAGPGGASVPADGVFYVVMLALPADTPFVATVVDAAGRRYERARDVEELLGQHLPVGDPTRVRLVFDLPDQVDAPHLVLREPGLRARLFGRRIALPL